MKKTTKQKENKEIKDLEKKLKMGEMILKMKAIEQEMGWLANKEQGIENKRIVGYIG